MQVLLVSHFVGKETDVERDSRTFPRSDGMSWGWDIVLQMKQQHGGGYK